MVQRVFASKNQMATFTCPQCGQIRQMDVSAYMNIKKRVRLKYRCLCKHSFSVILERRKYFRKEVKLVGSVIQKKIKFPFMISNISRYGLKMTMLHKTDLKIGDQLRIGFTLDDKNRSEVFKNVIVKDLQHKDVGVEFLSKEHYDKFGTYILFNLS
ncbi:MAG: PilZ domain-containing protein [Desulfobacteraceae bacterium]|nr:PilZ domain-containing protein [Desulfobacteraceae bacterium]